MKLKLLSPSFRDFDVNNRILCETVYFVGLPFKVCAFLRKKSSSKVFCIMHPMGYVPIYVFHVVGSRNKDVSISDFKTMYYNWYYSTFDNHPVYEL